VNQSSPEGQAHLKNLSDINASRVKSKITSDINIQRAKANLELGDQARQEAKSLSNARINAANQGETRGMSRRVHRRRGPSAFAAMGKLANESRASASKEVGAFFDTLQKEQIGQTMIGAGITPPQTSSAFRKPKIR
jgi:hypothetical protein